jgi:Flp pilus assembly pilin Flp
MRDTSLIDRVLLLCVVALALVGVITLFGDQVRALFESGTAGAALAP